MNSLKTKQELIAEIKQCQIKQEIEKDIKTVLDQFKHYKTVNKRFTDKLNEMGYYSYLDKVNGKHRLGVIKTVDNCNVPIEIYVWNQDLTWDEIERQLGRYEKQEKSLQHNLACYDADLDSLKYLVSVIEQMPEGSNFKSEISRFLSDLKWGIEKIERAS